MLESPLFERPGSHRVGCFDCQATTWIDRADDEVSRYEEGMIAIERINKSSFPAIFTGAPLDLIKVVAAVSMCLDHVNIIFLGHQANMLWTLGRLAFPLFSFALACNIHRGASVPKYLATLLLLGIISQPIYASTIGSNDANILITLAAGVAAATILVGCSAAVQHIFFAVGVAVIFTPFLRSRAGMDFGLAGMLFPAALFLTMQGMKWHALWVALLLIGLNWHYPDPWQFAPISTGLLAAAGTALTLALASLLQNHPRFLPRYALHLFYPGHLLVLGLIHIFW
jgi:TraX protein